MPDTKIKMASKILTLKPPADLSINIYLLPELVEHLTKPPKKNHKLITSLLDVKIGRPAPICITQFLSPKRMRDIAAWPSSCISVNIKNESIHIIEVVN